MINWKHIEKEKPIQGEEIWVLLYHWKQHFPSSFQIAAGFVEYEKDENCRVNTLDYDGSGCHCFYPENDPSATGFDEHFEYWCNKEEINVPQELIE